MGINMSLDLTMMNHSAEIQWKKYVDGIVTHPIYIIHILDAS